MNVEIDCKLEQKLKIAMAKRNPKLTLKTAITEAIELWIAKEEVRNA